MMGLLPTDRMCGCRSVDVEPELHRSFDFSSCTAPHVDADVWLEMLEVARVPL